MIDDTGSKRWPVAFISHSSADKKRLVGPLDALLRARGVDTWLDERDLLPGKNLVDEIFEHGISKSDAFVAILSANSIHSKWVHEELTNAVVQKIKGVVKIIIPVVLDGIKPPGFLDHVVWEEINDPGDLTVHAERIVASIFGTRGAPIAPAPAYAGMPIHRLAQLTPNDERIFVRACQQLLSQNPYGGIVEYSELLEFGRMVEMSEDDVIESVAALEQQGYFCDVVHYGGEKYPAAGQISDNGLEEYLRHYMPNDYRKAKLGVLSEIVNQHVFSSSLMVQSLNVNAAIVEHILRELEYAGHVLAAHHSEGIDVHPNATLSRVLRRLEAEQD